MVFLKALTRSRLNVLWLYSVTVLAGANTTVKIASLKNQGKNLIVHTTAYQIQKDSFKQYYDRDGSALSYYEIKSFQLAKPIIEKKSARKLYFSLGGRLFEGVDLKLKSGSLKKAAQLITTDADGYLKGEAQSLEAKTCQELGKLFSGKIPPELKSLKVRPEQLQSFQKGKC